MGIPGALHGEAGHRRLLDPRSLCRIRPHPDRQRDGAPLHLSRVDHMLGLLLLGRARHAHGPGCRRARVLGRRARCTHERQRRRHAGRYRGGGGERRCACKQGRDDRGGRHGLCPPRLRIRRMFLRGDTRDWEPAGLGDFDDVDGLQYHHNCRPAVYARWRATGQRARGARHDALAGSGRDGFAAGQRLLQPRAGEARGRAGQRARCAAGADRLCDPGPIGPALFARGRARRDRHRGVRASRDAHQARARRRRRARGRRRGGRIPAARPSRHVDQSFGR
mmetsp:Transcript_3900/g.9887  ORF Transcript_3900/g.9887 Transcript_3900/m.9887 type:complete len:279 (+) Transcript_3900:339-1175(+)